MLISLRLGLLLTPIVDLLWMPRVQFRVRWRDVIILSKWVHEIIWGGIATEQPEPGDRWILNPVGKTGLDNLPQRDFGRGRESPLGLKPHLLPDMPTLGFDFLLGVNKDESAVGPHFYPSLIAFKPTRLLGLRWASDRLWWSWPVSRGPEIFDESPWSSEPIGRGRGSRARRPFVFIPRNPIDADRTGAGRKAVL